MSCIYGPHQCGTEDQGWVAHFALQAMHGRPITIYGDGRQVRDVLFVEDLVDALLLAVENAKQLGGRAFNIGGGPSNAVSLLEVLDVIGELEGEKPAVLFKDWRVGDQRYYVSDTSAFNAATGWSPRVDVGSGVARLHQWLASSPLGRHTGITAIQQGVA
jgi:CDP-paratose 2-epimerase